MVPFSIPQPNKDLPLNDQLGILMFINNILLEEKKIKL
jgi:hypothetical protein